MLGGWRTLRRKGVVVALDTGRSFEGVLYATPGPLLVLRQARLLEPGHDALPVDGEVVLPRERVEFLQIVPARVP